MGIATDLIMPPASGPLPQEARRAVERARTQIHNAAAQDALAEAAAGLRQLVGPLRMVADLFGARCLEVQEAHVDAAADALTDAYVRPGEADEETWRGELDCAADRALASLQAALDAEAETVIALPAATETTPAPGIEDAR